MEQRILEFIGNLIFVHALVYGATTMLLTIIFACLVLYNIVYKSKQREYRKVLVAKKNTKLSIKIMLYIVSVVLEYIPYILLLISATMLIGGAIVFYTAPF